MSGEIIVTASAMRKAVSDGKLKTTESARKKNDESTNALSAAPITRDTYSYGPIVYMLLSSSSAMLRWVLSMVLRTSRGVKSATISARIGMRKLGRPNETESARKTNMERMKAPA